MTLFRSFLVLTCTLGACGGEIASSTRDAAPPAADDASIATDGGAIAPDAGAIEGIAHCTWEQGGSMKTVAYEKHCATSIECTIGFHLNNCCGQLIALGVNLDDVARFERRGGICGDEFGGLCDCSIGGIATEDGNVSRTPKGTDIVATCVAGQCRTKLAR